MSQAITSAPVEAEHVKFMCESYDEMDEQAILEQVCNQGEVLPQAKVGNQWHMPMCWLGGGEIRGLTPEIRRKEAQKRLGWRPVKYLFISSNPSDVDLDYRIGFCSKSRAGSIMRKEITEAGIALGESAVSYVSRFQLPATVNQYTQRHKNSCLAYLLEDIQQCKPDVIITLGADALKALYGKKAKLDTYHGNVLKYPVAGREIPVVPTYSHLSFIGGYAEISVFRADLRRVMEIGQRIWSEQQTKSDYRLCRSLQEVEALCDEIERDAPPWIAFDTEFGNHTAREEHTETISIQLAWGPGKAAFIQLTEEREVFRPEPDIPEIPPLTGIMSFEQMAHKTYKHPEKQFERRPESVEKVREKLERYNQRLTAKYDRYCEEARQAAEKAVVWRIHHEYHYVRDGRYFIAMQRIHQPEVEQAIWRRVQKLLLDKRWRICAHHLRTDCYQFERNGVPITDRIEDGLDTMLMHHLLYGDESQGLDHLCRKFMPQYGAFWMELEQWLESTGRRGKHLQFGYRDIPMDILIPYAQKDADVTWQVAAKLLELMHDDKVLRKLYFKHVAPTSWHLYQVERAGILIDEQRREALREAYEPVYDELLKRVREEVEWPGFNPGSSDQMRTLLYYGATKYRDEKPPPEGITPKLRKLKPLFNTDKYPRSWDDILEAGEESMNNPSTKAEALELLHSEYPKDHVLVWLRHLSVVGKFLSTYLSPQEINEFGVVEDGKGLANNIDSDGRVRTHLSQLTGTGRYSSSKANLQTKPKKQEAAAFAALVDFYFGIDVDTYKERTDDDNKHLPDWIPPERRIKVPKFATTFIAREGYCLIEADFATAEMCIWAYVSGDENLIKVVRLGRDMHSEICAKSFKLPEGGKPLADALAKLEGGDREDYDKWADDIKSKYGPLRIAAKSVNFGVMYGRGAAALAREINKVVDDPVTPQDTQQIIDGLAEQFPQAWQWLVDNSNFAVENEYVPNAFGRRRYFQGARDMSDRDKAAVQREAKNSPIQGCIDIDDCVYTFGGVRRLADMAHLPQERVSHGNLPAPAVYVPRGLKDTIMVVLANGASVCCTPDHELQVLTPSGREWARADSVDGNTLVVWEPPVFEDTNPAIRYSSQHEGSNARFNQCIELQITERFGYLLGFTVGDGSISGGRNDVRYTAAKKDACCLDPIIAELNRLGLHVQKSDTGSKIHVGTTSAAFKQLLLESCGIDQRLHNSTGIPTVVFNCTKQTQFAALDGYLTADGTVNPRDGSVTWVTKSERLCRDVANLVAALGYRSSWFVDGQGYYRGAIPRNAVVELEKEYSLFKFHGRKRRMLEQRSLVGGRRSSSRKLRLPHWYALQCLPQEPPKQRYHSSAYVLYNRVKRGMDLSLEIVKQYSELGWHSPEPVMPAIGSYSSGQREVADLSIATTKSDRRWFAVNGFRAHNCVADLLAKAGYMFHRIMRKLRQQGKAPDVEILLPVHDAFLFEIKISDLPEVIPLIDFCLGSGNKVPGTDYHLGVDIEVFPRSWGDKAIDPHKAPQKMLEFVRSYVGAA